MPAVNLCNTLGDKADCALHFTFHLSHDFIL